MNGGGHPRLLDEVEKALGGARSIHDVPAVLARVLGDRFELCRVSLRAVVPGTNDVEILAVWSLRHTDLAPGVRMPLRSTTLANVVATASTQVSSNVRPEDGLLHGILAAEGIRSYASAPLGDVARGAPVLSLSSSGPETFGPDDLPLVAAIAVAVAARLDDLAT